MQKVGETYNSAYLCNRNNNRTTYNGVFEIRASGLPENSGQEYSYFGLLAVLLFVFYLPMNSRKRSLSAAEEKAILPFSL